MTDITITHQTEARRFQTSVDGHEAELLYGLRDGQMIIQHTGVPQAVEGRGIAASLVKAALEYARAQNLKVIPACSYSAAYVERHPEYADLIA